ncbi:N-acetylglutamate synthase, CG3035 family [Williamsia sterculiae]|uniref:Ribosomal protein S18 acetylase RimI n=1 Tax=Williamsia sterculiae TaxID=1344003 RepID=A0A1N7F0P8_9NOCA|nr:GNAT family N-acetyltransferase [Williamsia sterculiae]SIR93929.1 Ribosomal protein S18 acetylase RimI [Williamsia sterculiae]
MFGDRPQIGDRVVVRHRITAPSDGTPVGYTRTDVTGPLLSTDPLRVQGPDGPVQVAADAVDSVRLLSRETVRNSEIRQVESAAANNWPGVERAHVQGWLLRAGGGFTRRANSAAPLDVTARLDDATVAAIRDWYADRGLPPLLAVVERLIPIGHIPAGTLEAPVHVLVRDIEHPPSAQSVTAPSDTPVTIRDAASDEWVRSYVDGRGDRVDLPTARQVVDAVVDGRLGFAEVRRDGRLVGVGRGSVTTAPDGTAWFGLTAVWCSPDVRRLGVARAVVDALTAWGVDHGATRAQLQVEADNDVAGAWYRRLGYGLHHRYGYVRL